MVRFSSREAAKRLGIGHETLANYVRSGKLPSPETIQQGQRMAHSWTEEDIERVRELLPKIANGRKTRNRKNTKAGGRIPKLAGIKAKTIKPQGEKPVPHKKK